MANNFYEDKINEIKYLMDDNPKKAYELLVEELKMPYIPMKYESIFLDLKQKIFSSINEGTIKSISTEDVLQMLYESEENQDIALNLLAKHNLHEHKTFLKKRIEDWDSKGKDKIRKSLLFEIMSEQNIDVDMKINDQVINPIADSIFDDKESIVAFTIIKNSNSQNPQVIEIAMMQLNQYLLLTFPNKIKDGNLLAQQLINISQHMLEPNFEINQQEKDVLEFLK